jgi:hypothetical protein
MLSDFFTGSLQKMSVNKVSTKTNFLKTNKFLLLVVILAMLNNLEHSAYVYHSISKHTFGIPWLDWLQAGLVVVIIDLAVIAFVVNGRHKEAGIYSIAIFLINLIYSDGINMFFLQPIVPGTLINHGSAKIIYALMFTYSIYIFSKMYFERLENEKEEAANQLRIAALEQQLIEAEAALVTWQQESQLQFSKLKAAEAALEQERSNHAAELLEREAAMLQQLAASAADLQHKDAVAASLSAKYLQLEQRLAAAEQLTAIQAAEFEQVAAIYLQLEEKEKELEQVQAALQKYLDKLTCECGFVAESGHALSGHKKSCSKPKEIKPEREVG